MLPDSAPGRGPFGNTVWVQTEAKAVRQKVLVVTSGTKGGTGKTTLSVNMACAAAALAQEDSGKIRVVLVDFNESGNVAMQLGLGEDIALTSTSGNTYPKSRRARRLTRCCFSIEAPDCW
jgi:cellulose biosynthesis protein BcsQ